MKSKEEMLKQLEKNYYTVQKKECEVYDQGEKLKQSFDKSIKAETAKQKKVQKECLTLEKNTTAKFKANLLDLKKNLDVKKVDLELVRKETKKELADQLKASKEIKVVGTTELKKEIELANKQNEDTLASIVTQYDSNVVELNKRVVVLHEKLKKDNHSFEQKLVDLQAKHEQAIESIQENEKTKTGKLTEASKKDTLKIQEEIDENREKVSRRLDALKAVYEDELEEIDEKIETSQIEFNEKYANIKTSNEQRITVREKHLQRALDDKDNRSAKIHKKDIVKIQKEMEKDLQLLKKHFEAEQVVSADYRYNFIKDNLEKWAVIEREFIKTQENKQLEIDVLNAGLDSRIKLANLDFEKQHVTALQAYHTQFAATKEKQLSFELETNGNLANEELEKETLALRFKEENDIAKESLKERLESLSKQQKDLELQNEESDFKSKIAVDKTMAKVDNDSTLAQLEFDYFKKIAEEDEKIENHQTEFTRHDAFKNELLGFEQNLKDLFVDRQNGMVEFETLEVTNRYEQKVKYLNKQIAELSKNYTAMVSKAEEINKLDKAFYESQITDAVGSLQDELDEYLEEETTKLEEKEAELRSLNPKKQKKQYRALQIEVDNFRESFEQEKASKQQLIDSKVDAYKTALVHSNERLQTALTEMDAFFTKELSMLENAVSDCEASKDRVLTTLAERQEATISNMEDYQAKVLNRSEMNQKHNEEYLNAQILKQTSEKDVIKKEYEELLSSENARYQETLSVISTNESQTLGDIARRKEELNTRLVEYKQDTQKAINQIKTETSNKIKSLEAQNAKTIEELNQKFDKDTKAIKDELKDQLDQHNDHLTVIEKSVNEESSKLEQETRKLSKVVEDKIKDDISIVDNKLKQDIQNIK